MNRLALCDPDICLLHCFGEVHARTKAHEVRMPVRTTRLYHVRQSYFHPAQLRHITETPVFFRHHSIRLSLNAKSRNGDHRHELLLRYVHVGQESYILYSMRVQPKTRLTNLIILSTYDSGRLRRATKSEAAFFLSSPRLIGNKRGSASSETSTRST